MVYIFNGCHNIAQGCKALYGGPYTGNFSTFACYNIAIGGSAMSLSTGTNFNTAVGHFALCGNATGCSNTAIGYCAGATVQSGSNNTLIGYGALPLAANCNNTITLGNASIATIRAQVTTITALSDCRDKTNICSIPVGLEFVRALRPVKFDWNMRSGAKIGVPEAGFIAQDLKAVQEKFTATDYLNLVISNEDESRYEATPGKLLPVIVRALQELAEENENLRSRIEVLEGREL
jgi:hypothetical protein